MSLGEAFYAYNRHEFTICIVKEIHEKAATEALKMMVGTFADESSFIGIETAGNIIVLKAGAPLNSSQQQTSIKMASQFCSRLMACSSEEHLMAEVN